MASPTPGSASKDKETKATVNAASKKPAPFGSIAPWAEPAWCNSLSSPYYNDSHRKQRDYIRQYIDEHIAPHQAEWIAAGGVPQAVREKWALSGLAFGDVPTKYRPKHLKLPNPSGLDVEDHDIFHLLVGTDEGSRIRGGVGSSLAGASVIGVPPIINHGTEQQKQRWLPGLFDCSTSFCLGITEPSGGSDVSNIKTTARKTADGKFYIVNGTKKWITGAPWATHMTTAVRTGGPGMGGISMLVIPVDSPGFSQKRIANSGQEAGGASWMFMEDVKVPVENLLGKENEGFKIIMTNFTKERFIMAVGCNRAARTCLSVAFEYAHTRETFGKPLITHQIIRHKIATLAREVESHWAWLEQLAYHIQQSPLKWQAPDIAGKVALAKVSGGRILELACREAQQVLGGAGYQKGNHPGGIVEQISRDLRMMVVGGGSEEIIEDLAVRQETGVATKRGWKL